MKTRRILFLCLLWGGLVILAQQLGLRAFVRQELASLDLRCRFRGVLPAPTNIVIFAIDQASTSLSDRFDPLPAPLVPLKNFPYPRTVYAAAIEKLMAAGTQRLGIDLLFISPKDGDDRLQEVLTRFHERVVVGANFSDDGRQLLMPVFDGVAGYVNYWPDLDGTVRRVRHEVYASDIAGVARSPNERPERSFDSLIAGKTATETLINFSGRVKTISFYQLFSGEAWTNDVRNAVVLIGPAGNFQHDQHPTPFGPMDGVEIHANAIGTLLRGDAPREAAGWVGVLTVVLLALGAAGILRTTIHPLGKLGVLTVLGGAYFGLAQLAFARGAVLLIAAPLWTVAGGGILGIAMQVVTERLERLRVRRTLDRYVSKQVAEEILRHGDEYAASLGGERRPVTILFSDIRGFTTISEQTSPVELLGRLNEYLTAMVDVVMKHDGTLDKFIGDAIMAVWGAPTSAGEVEDAWRAVQSAAGMRDRLAELRLPWRIGIGLNHGEVVVGNIGSPQRMEYTVIGDAVNVASRVEGLNKDFGTDILLTESVYELVKERVEVKLIGGVAVKGREQKVNVYALVRIGRTD